MSYINREETIKFVKDHKQQSDTHAHWKMTVEDSIGRPIIGVCSNCNRQDHIDPLAAYCRYCGAKMDEGEP